MTDLEEQILEQAILLRDEVGAFVTEQREGFRGANEAFDRMGLVITEILLALEATGENLTVVHEKMVYASSALGRIERRLGIVTPN